MSPGHALSFWDIFLKFSLITAVAVINYAKYLYIFYLILTIFDQESLKPVFVVPWTCFSKNMQKHQKLRKNELNLVSKCFYLICYAFSKIINELLWKMSLRHQIRLNSPIFHICFWRNHKKIAWIWLKFVFRHL